ncbi:MAG: cation diffusion facilitator family transporter [Rhodothermales bacterium]
MNPIAAARLSVVVGLVVLALKYVAYRLTGSVSLYSDALESIVNVVAAVAVVISIRVAAQPPDLNHPFGHSKAEYFSAVLEGGLILFAAVEIVRAAWQRFLEPLALTDLNLGLGVALLATALNGAMAGFLVWNGKKQRSPALVADGKHLRTDVVTTMGVLAGVGLAGLTGWWILDPLLAVLVAVNIMWVGLRLVRDSMGGLMDESLPAGTMATIQHVIADHMDEALEVHDLRSRQAGRHTFVEFHLVVPGPMSVAASHAICDRLEETLRRAVPGSVVTIHVEPEEKAHRTGRVMRIGAPPDAEK